jgi:hypothetical protein
MPRFFFDVLELSGRITRDEIGTECTSAARARHEADRLLASIFSEAPRRISGEIKVEVRDAAGNAVGGTGVRFTDGSITSPAAVFLGC